MKNIKETFTLERLDNTDEYIAELQDTLDKLGDLICRAGKHICNDESESDYPIWEYVINENRVTIPYLIAELVTQGYNNTGLEDNTERMKDILNLITSRD
jgi:hypothetical protein